jgi:acetyl/propionyl-CoA carboxylase alpha subunit
VPANVRFDAGVAAGGEVSAAFDPMIGKLIVHGVDRSDALAKINSALAQLVLFGVTTNIAYLRRLLTDPAVASGAIHTGLIAEKEGLLADLAPQGEMLARILAAAAPLLTELKIEADRVPPLHRAIGSWRN